MTGAQIHQVSNWPGRPFCDRLLENRACLKTAILYTMARGKVGLSEEMYLKPYEGPLSDFILIPQYSHIGLYGL